MAYFEATIALRVTTEVETSCNLSPAVCRLEERLLQPHAYPNIIETKFSWNPLEPRVGDWTEKVVCLQCWKAHGAQSWSMHRLRSWCEMLDEGYGGGAVELASGESLGVNSVVSGPVPMRSKKQKLD